MQISKFQLLDGAKKGRGTTIIIDVFRAFSVECYLMNNGATRIYPVGSIQQASHLKKENPDYVLIGERHEKMCEGFDFGNSPTHLLNVNFSGKTIVHTTSSGTQGIDLATNATEILTGSFVNASAIVRYLKKIHPDIVSLVSMGYEGLYATDEDTYCADFIENELLGRQTDFNAMVESLKKGDGARLLNPRNKEHSPASDFGLCLDLNRFSFVLRVVKDENGLNYLERNDV